MYLFFDTETTGLPKRRNAPLQDLDNWPRLVQIAWLLCDNEGKQIDGKNYIVKPEGFSIPLESEKVHGISTQRALDEGVDLSMVLNKFARAIEEAKFLVAHNISFDEKIAATEFLRKNIANTLFEMERICTMQTTTNFCKIIGNYGYKWPSLSELHIILFNKDFEDAHDALVDVKACARCFFELKRREIL